MNQQPGPITVATNVYRLLLRLYPPSFRDECGAEMLQVFQTCCHIRYETAGTWSLWTFCLHTLFDLVATAALEWWQTWLYALDQERSQRMLRPVDEYRPFMEEVTASLDRRPDYYYLFVANIESLQSVGTVADCLALEGDLNDPTALFALFQDAGDTDTIAGAPRWLARLCAAVRQSLQDISPGPSAIMTNQLIERIYANPTLFELIAAEEVGQQLVDVVESLALDGDVEEIDEMLALMQELGH